MSLLNGADQYSTERAKFIVPCHGVAYGTRITKVSRDGSRMALRLRESGEGDMTSIKSVRQVKEVPWGLYVSCLGGRNIFRARWTLLCAETTPTGCPSPLSQICVCLSGPQVCCVDSFSYSGGCEPPSFLVCTYMREIIQTYNITCPVSYRSSRVAQRDGTTCR